MSIIRRAGLAAVAASGLVLAAAAPAPPAPALNPAAAAGHPSEVSLPDTRRIAFVSKLNGRHYSIDVALPILPPPPEGYPVIYVLDGDAYFPSAAEAVNAIAANAIVVGIGYSHEPAWIAASLAKHAPITGLLAVSAPFDTMVAIEREYDMSLTPDATSIRSMGLAGATVTAADFGGMDDYLKIIETEVKPMVYGLAPVNRNDQTLFGHSLGGLTVVEALFTEPTAFRTFVAASPSLWWGDREVLKKEAAFDAAVSAGRAAPRVLITVGGDEEAAPKLPPEMADKQVEINTLIKNARMVGNACDLAKRLQTLHGAQGYQVEDCAVFAGQGHQISPWPAIGRGVVFAFP
jgi:predicted alpha/beta superfamily hydrolase